MAFFREGMEVGEEEMLEIERISSTDDPYLASALSSVYDDTNNLVSGCRSRAWNLHENVASCYRSRTPGYCY